jgi:hypothetical protein
MRSGRPALSQAVMASKSRTSYWGFASPPETWRKLCGREGWFVFDYEKLKTQAFIVTIRN